MPVTTSHASCTWKGAWELLSISRDHCTDYMAKQLSLEYYTERAAASAIDK